MTITLNGTTGIVNTGSETITGALTAANFNGASTFGFKNRIINGAMVIDQRNAGAVSTPANTTYTLDRWKSYQTTASKYSVQQTPSATETGYATRVAAGFTNYLAVTSLSAYSVSASDYYTVQQVIEGFNTADLAWGTASAKTVTLSFWVYSSLGPGTFGGSIFNAAGNRSYPFSYSISAANTWQQITVTIAGDTTGTWAGATNTASLQLCFGLGAGSTYTTTANAWAAGLYTQPNSTVSVVGTNGATFYITGVQLETGTVATTFEYRPYGTELQLCQRYFWKAIEGTPSVVLIGTGVITGGSNMRVFIPLPVPMRALPTGTRTGTVYGYDGSNQQAIDGGSFGFSSTIALAGDLTSSLGGFTLGRGLVIYAGNGTGNNITASSEL
jgi:hypothetical protein